MKNQIAFFLSLTHGMVVKILFSDQIFEEGILIDLQILKHPESKNYIFSDWSMYMCITVTSKMVFCICIIRSCCLKRFTKI